MREQGGVPVVSSLRKGMLGYAHAGCCVLTVVETAQQCMLLLSLPLLLLARVAQAVRQWRCLSLTRDKGASSSQVSPHPRCPLHP